MKAHKIGIKTDLGPGGWKCHCCGPKPGLERKKFKRRVRRKLKLRDQKENLNAGRN